MPHPAHHGRFMRPRVFTDASLAQLDSGLRLDSADLAIKTVSDRDAHAAPDDSDSDPAAAAAAAGGGPELGTGLRERGDDSVTRSSQVAVQPSARSGGADGLAGLLRGDKSDQGPSAPLSVGDGLAGILASAARVSSRLLNLSAAVSRGGDAPEEADALRGSAGDDAAPGAAPSRSGSAASPRWSWPFTNAGGALPALRPGDCLQELLLRHTPEALTPQLRGCLDAAARVADTLDTLARVLSPTPVPLGLAFLFAACAFVPTDLAPPTRPCWAPILRAFLRAC